MRICHVTPHLPPDQAANALLPFHLGWWAREAGDEVTYIAHAPRQARADPSLAPPAPAGPVMWVERPAGGGLLRKLGAGNALAALRMARLAWPAIAAADLVHVHSNGLLAECCAVLAARRRKPVVLTLYGTEIWHYRARRWRPDLFTRAYRSASAVTFYSRGLLDFARGLGLDRPNLQVVYPPIAREFVANGAAGRETARAELGIHASRLLLNVKRLHPLAGQRFLVEAMPAVLAAHPDTLLVICGTGPLADELQELARQRGVAQHVTLAGLVPNERIAVYDRAADLFVLPSLLEACPTVALEALACGTPVVSSDNPGGVELHALFGDDFAVVPRENAPALAQAIIAALAAPRRTRPATIDALEREFRPNAVSARFYDVYRRALAAARHASRGPAGGTRPEGSLRA